MMRASPTILKRPRPGEPVAEANAVGAQQQLVGIKSLDLSSLPEVYVLPCRKRERTTCRSGRPASGICPPVITRRILSQPDTQRALERAIGCLRCDFGHEPDKRRVAFEDHVELAHLVAGHAVGAARADRPRSPPALHPRRPRADARRLTADAHVVLHAAYCQIRLCSV